MGFAKEVVRVDDRCRDTVFPVLSVTEDRLSDTRRAKARDWRTFRLSDFNNLRAHESLVPNWREAKAPGSVLSLRAPTAPHGNTLRRSS
jgi:hypothetical protein